MGIELKRKVIILFITTSLIIFAELAFGMNDTNAVVGNGIFPDYLGSKALQLISKQDLLQIKEEGFKSKIIYTVENTGPSGDYKFLFYMTRTGYTLNVIKTVTVDGAIVNLTPKIGQLADEGSYVKISYMTKKEIDSCRENVDGDICDHEWSEFIVHFSEHESKTMSYEWETDTPLSCCVQFSLYSEKFWTNDIIPAVDFVVDLSEMRLPITLFNTSVSSLPEDPQPSVDFKDNLIAMHYVDYKPRKEAYTYSTATPSINLETALSEYVRTAYTKSPQSLLSTALTDSNPFVRAYTASMLGKSKSANDVPALIELLNDPSHRVRQVAINSLILITGENYHEDKAKWESWWNTRNHRQATEVVSSSYGLLFITASLVLISMLLWRRAQTK
jgi:hypothetical protein